jgi:nucleotide-binding universal stress UspA family protein
VRRIVVGVDGSENSRRALEWAARQVRRDEGELVIVHAWTLPASAHGTLVVPNHHALETRQAYQDAARAKVESALAQVDLDGVRQEIRVVEGLPGEALVEASRDASMIVVGHRARRRLAAFVLGSTAQFVSRRSAVPVLVVPELADTTAVAA